MTWAQTLFLAAPLWLLALLHNRVPDDRAKKASAVMAILVSGSFLCWWFGL